MFDENDLKRMLEWYKYVVMHEDVPIHIDNVLLAEKISKELILIRMKGYSDTDSYIIDDEDLTKAINIMENIIIECPNCKGTNFARENDRIECIRCGWIKTGKKGS